MNKYLGNKRLSKYILSSDDEDENINISREKNKNEDVIKILDESLDSEIKKKKNNNTKQINDIKI